MPQANRIPLLLRAGRWPPHGLAPPGRCSRLLAAVAVGRAMLPVRGLADVEVKPLRCAAEGVVALDARLLVQQ
jgi:hypothetical protein